MASLVGLGGGALAVARYRDIDIGLSAPRRGSWPSALGAVVAPAALVVAVAAVGNALFGVSLSAMTMVGFSAEISVGTFLLTVVVPSAFLGVGYALLFCGLVYERAHELLDSGEAAAVAAMLAGFFWVLPVDPMGVRLTVGGAFELLASLVFGVAFAAVLGLLYGRDGPSFAGLASHHWVVLVVAAVGVVGVATDLTDVRAVGELLWVAALALAVVGYARTRSVWVAALSLVVFRITLLGVVFVESSLAVP